MTEQGGYLTDRGRDQAPRGCIMCITGTGRAGASRAPRRALRKAAPCRPDGNRCRGTGTGSGNAHYVSCDQTSYKHTGHRDPGGRRRAPGGSVRRIQLGLQSWRGGTWCPAVRCAGTAARITCAPGGRGWGRRAWTSKPGPQSTPEVNRADVGGGWVVGGMGRLTRVPSVRCPFLTAFSTGYPQGFHRLSTGSKRRK